MKNSITREGLFGDENGKPPTPPTLEAIVEYLAGQVFEGLVSWDIKHEDGQPYPLTMDNCKNVVSLFTDFHLELFKAIGDFNNGIPADTKKK